MRLFATLLISVVFSTAAFADTKTLRWAHVYETSTPYHTCALEAGERLFAETEGRYNIDVFAASSLGREVDIGELVDCLLYTSPSPRDS